MRKAISLCALLTFPLFADTGAEAWLRHAALDGTTLAEARRALPAAVLTLGASPLQQSARGELIAGVRGLLGRTLREQPAPPREGSIVLATLAQLQSIPGLRIDAALPADAFLLKSVSVAGVRHLVVTAANDAGVLYGTFALLRRIALGQPLIGLDIRETPYAPVRWINQWDNLDGTIERGYGGRSIFWDKNDVRDDLSRVTAYARLLASLGINACSINNVNANPRAISSEFLPQVERIAAAMRPWGVHVALSIDFASPRSLGGLDTFDPLDARVVAFWKTKVDEIYTAIPDLAGFVLKADSEGRVGPSAYGRTHADAANVVARALAPHGGIIFYRGFVYDHHMDWRNLKNDRARAAHDNFVALDGKFDSNVIIQIKHGPIDFQVREPASPLFGALEKSNQAIELQITQEYFGQARQTVFLVPMWKEALDFDMQAGAAATPVKALVAGRVFHRPTGGFVGVANVGLDANWLGNHLSQANLYGFGRLAWNPDLSARQIVDEWTRLTLGGDAQLTATANELQLRSWPMFENYTGPLGLQTLTDIVGNHFGVSVEASERNGWGQWHRSDEHGAGMDRSTATGTGFIGQYRAGVARVYESLATCPDNLLLFMHHVPYTHKLHSGKTVIQYIYDSHYAGAAEAAANVEAWRRLRGRLDDQRYFDILAQLEYQAGQAEVWRDAVAGWYHRASSIPDSAGRVGRHAGRIEAESMQLEGYAPTAVTPWEGASGGQAVECRQALCKAAFEPQITPGWYTLNVRYFDQNNGAARYRLYVNTQLMDEWMARDWVPSAKIDSSSSACRLIRGVALRKGDTILVEAAPDGGEHAALDYVELLPERPN